MNTLRQALELHRTSEADTKHLCYTANADAVALVVEAGEVRWMLPWSHFLQGCHEAKVDDEILVLTFAHCAVALRGRRLGPLATEVARLRLERVRAGAENYDEAAGDEPWVSEIHVQPVESRPPQRAPKINES